MYLFVACMIFMFVNQYIDVVFCVQAAEAGRRTGIFHPCTSLLQAKIGAGYCSESRLHHVSLSDLQFFHVSPAVLPKPCWKRRGGNVGLQRYRFPVMAMSHRSVFLSILHHAEQDLRQLLKVPDSYRYCFCRAEQQPNLIWQPYECWHTVSALPTRW